MGKSGADPGGGVEAKIERKGIILQDFGQFKRGRRAHTPFWIHHWVSCLAYTTGINICIKHCE